MIAFALSVPSNCVSVPVRFERVDSIVTLPRRHLAIIPSSLIVHRRVNNEGGCSLVGV